MPWVWSPAPQQTNLFLYKEEKCNFKNNGNLKDCGERPPHTTFLVNTTPERIRMTFSEVKGCFKYWPWNVTVKYCKNCILWWTAVVVRHSTSIRIIHRHYYHSSRKTEGSFSKQLNGHVCAYKTPQTSAHYKKKPTFSVTILGSTSIL